MAALDFDDLRFGDLVVRTAPLGPIATNCYVIGCLQTGQGAIVDCCAEPDRIARMIAHEAPLTITHLLQTHAHIDHVSALAELRRRTQAPIVLHRDELPVYDSVPLQSKMFFGVPAAPLPPPDRFVAEGERIQVGSLEAEVFLTPGHTPGSVCYYFRAQGVMFSGDVLFAGSIGRTDLPGGDMRAMRASLARLERFSPETVVLSGHGPVTTIGEERAHNPFLGGRF